MTAKLMIIWDYDTALGQINSTMPYNFSYKPIYEEIENVDYILDEAQRANIKMTFACLGFAAEDGVFPFNNPSQIKKIHSLGHEIASHSWRHEWFPYINEKQIEKSLERSKFALENCLGVKSAVRGFVPPHSRPMSWYSKFSISLGDRGLYPFHKGSDIAYILKILREKNYSWCRVLKRYRPVWDKLMGSRVEEIEFNIWEVHNGIVCVPQHYTGFDDFAQKYLMKAIELKKAIVIVGHPAGLSRQKSESKEHFDRFLKMAEEAIAKGELEAMTVSSYINSYIERKDSKRES
jgi:hypothetical protein